MLEEIKNPGVFHQPGNKTEIRLAILHHEFTRLISARERLPEFSKTEIFKQLRDDVRYRFVLKDAAVRCAAKKPEPGHDVCLIVGEPGVLTRLGKLAYKTVEVAFAALAQSHADGDVLSDNRLRPNCSLVGEKLQPKVE